MSLSWSILRKLYKLPRTVLKRSAFISSDGCVRYKYTAQLCVDVQKEFDQGQLKYKKHPGIRQSYVHLPQELQIAAEKVLNGSGVHINHLRQESVNLWNLLWSRKIPVEESELQEKALLLEKQELEKDYRKLQESTTEEKEKLEQSRKDRVLYRLKRTMYHWKPIDYSYHQGLLYLAGRLAPDYASLTQIFSEVCSLYVFRAAHSAWGGSIIEYFCVDVSSDMNNLSQLLVQGGDENSRMFMDGIFFRQFLPASNERTYDIVTSCYSLLELPSASDRFNLIDQLWRKTVDMLVIIENGTKAGHTVVLEARDRILQKHFDEEEKPCVLAPCPHNMECPVADSKIPCNFEVSYIPLLNDKTMKKCNHRYSYVVLRKGRNGNKWPRIVEPVLPRRKHVVCRMCCNDGHLHEVIFTKAKHKGHLYRCARISHWGDLLPVDVAPSPVKESKFES
ncbi:methyltransferase-like protein 17, mitochondrial [Limulus polyphemus]|uniref:Methyltransferase-like protein 17, mitochondrial n=1 Tax=Limulus polyphemus TaxID=6850 RepID=A0ABM1TN09_LIMPO|nr:methyltransferase-like protein 17, mitochondrial [Limulus polyphemus]